MTQRLQAYSTYHSRYMGKKIVWNNPLRVTANQEYMGLVLGNVEPETQEESVIRVGGV